jgi:putative serine protease PepD
MRGSTDSAAGAGQASGPRRQRLLVAAGVVVVLLAGLVGALIANSLNSPATSAPSGSSASSSTAGACDATAVANKVLPSVVTILATGAGGAGSGSGEAIRSDGYILTNNHVIDTAASGGSVEVVFAGGQSEPATIVGRDPLTDLAVLKAQPTGELKPISLGSSDSVRVGEPVVALGAPLGLSGTVTAGIVSALDRTVEVPGAGSASALLVSAVQTDAAINPGNSGGALVNCSGQLIGVPTAGATVPSPSGQASGGSIGLGFAIPVDLASSVADEIISTGRVRHAFFGLQTVPIPASAAAADGVSQGLYVLAVTPEGPAARAGLAPDDVITSLDGQPATSNIQLQELTLTKSPGDVVTVGYERDGRSAETRLTLVAQP